METNFAAPQLVPESGEREYDYSQTGLAARGFATVLGGLAWSGIVGVFVYVWFFRSGGQPEGVLFTVGPALMLASFFLAGVWIVATGVGYILIRRNEKLFLSHEGLRWFDKLGREKVNCTWAQVHHVSEGRYSRVRFAAGSSAGPAPVRHLCQVTTEVGAFSFTDEISFYEGLKALFIERETSAPTRGSFSYRNPLVYVVVAIFTPGTLILVAAFFTQYYKGELIELDNRLQPMPLWEPLLVLALAAIFWTLFVYLILTARNERIVITFDRVSYFDKLGRLEVDVPITQIEKGSFSQSRGTYTGFKYSVKTPQGVITWSEYISGCTDLVRIMRGHSASSGESGSAF